MEKTIAVIKGDGIGPEIVNEALKVLDAIAKKYAGHIVRPAFFCNRFPVFLYPATFSL